MSKIYHITTKIPNGPRIYQIAVQCAKYNNIFHSNTLRKLTKIGIFGLQIYHLATLVLRPHATICILKGVVHTAAVFSSDDAISASTSSFLGCCFHRMDRPVE
jgi:hypothetical protein